MTQGHVFVVGSRLERFRWDVAIIPTSGSFGVRGYWHAAIGSDGAPHKPDGWTSGSTGRSPIDSRIWFIDVTGDVDELGDRLSTLFEAIASDLPEPGKNGLLPRVAIPVLGVGGGGHDRERGKVIRMLVTAARHAASNGQFDVVISAINASDHSAIQAYRRSLPTGTSKEFEASAHQLADSARSGHLALFIGAGVSVPAGLPSWSALLEQLSGDDTEAILSLEDPLDQGEMLRKKLGDELGVRVADITDAGGGHALSHALLASLPCREAVTTNFDECFESALDERRSEGATPVLPRHVPVGDERWLLKLHGSRTDPSSIVLSRRDFVRYQAKWGPSGAILQSLLMTRHVLVVGASFKDSNLLRLVHEVAEYRESNGVKSVMGTVVTLFAEPARARLLKEEFDYLSMVDDQYDDARLPEAGRELEIFLDLLAMYAAAEAPHLLDRRYTDLLKRKEERAVAAELAALFPRADALGNGSEGWRLVADTLKTWGAAPSDKQSKGRRART